MAGESKLMYQSCREDANLNQNEACYHLDIKDVSQLSRYENGHTTPPDEVVMKMAMVYRNKKIVPWHLRRIHPELAEFIPYPIETNSIYEAITDFNFIDDDAHEVLNNLKKYVKDGILSEDEKEMLRTVDKETIKQMRERLNGVFNYIEGI